jgi:hypothetical protein
MLALTAARKMMEGLSAAPLSDAASTALTKINDALPREVAQRAARFDDVLSAQLGAVHDYAAKSDALRTLVDAIERQESVRFKYREAGDRTGAERVVDPYTSYTAAAIAAPAASLQVGDEARPTGTALCAYESKKAPDPCPPGGRLPRSATAAARPPEADGLTTWSGPSRSACCCAAHPPPGTWP